MGNTKGKKNISEGQKRNIKSIAVKGSRSKIYTELFRHVPKNRVEKDFLIILKAAIADKTKSFNVPVCDPSIDENGRIQFIPGCKVAGGYSYNEWEKMAKENDLRLGTFEEYHMFLGTLIYRLMRNGWTEDAAWHAVCIDSTPLGHYRNSENASCDLELTGSREIAGKCDLANVQKILAKDSNGWYWIAGGNAGCHGEGYSLVHLYYEERCDRHASYEVAWLVF